MSRSIDYVMCMYKRSYTMGYRISNNDVGNNDTYAEQGLVVVVCFLLG